jgi:hypothetical protein
VSLASKLKISSQAELATIIFYIASGIIFLAILPFTNFAPHLALLGIFSLITAFSVLTKRVWALWLVFILFVVATTFSLWTIFSTGVSNWIVTLSLIAYVALTWIFTAYLELRKKPES